MTIQFCSYGVLAAKHHYSQITSEPSYKKLENIQTHRCICTTLSLFKISDKLKESLSMKTIHYTKLM